MSDFDDDVDKFKKDVKRWTDMNRLNQRETVRIGNQFIGKMKEEIARGLSPLTRKKFPKYKNPDRYPGGRKAAAPVNLELSGDMLGDLKLDAVVTSGKDITLFIKYDTAQSAKKEQGHREGANGQPKRPTLPQGAENFSAFLTKELVASYVKLIEKFDV